MGRIRTIKPELFRHELLQDLEERHPTLRPMLVFTGLMTQADREGRFRWNPRMLKLDVLPFVAVDLAGSMDLLAANKLLRKYQIDGQQYGCFPTWAKHQVINNKERDSELPAPTTSLDSDASGTRDYRVEYASSTPLNPSEGEGKGKEGELELEKEKDTSASPQASSPAESPPAEDPPRGKSEERDEKAAIGRLFHFYCEVIRRDPARYTLTPVREKKALLRLRERRRVHGGDLEAAERDLGQAIENLAASEWHRENGHFDWLEQIFRSAEEFERRMNWEKPKGDQIGNGNFESRNQRIARETLAKLDSVAAGAAG